MHAGRPLGFDPDAALEAAMQLFWRRGYGATSLQELLECMGIARSSFYQSFGGKRAMFELALDRYRENLARSLREELTAAPSGFAFICATLESVAGEVGRNDDRRGCLVFNSAAEFGQSDPGVAAHVRTSIDAFARVFAEAVRRAQAEGDIDLTRDAAALGRYVASAMSGLRTLAKAGSSREELLEIARIAATSLAAPTAHARPIQN